MITKNNSITKFIAAGILVLTISFNAVGQATDNDQIKSKATVLTAINVTGISDLNFGFVSPGVNKTVGLDGVATGAANVNQTNVTVGQFEVEAGLGAAVNLEYTVLPLLITHTDGTHKLKVPTYTSVWNTTPTAAGGTSVNTLGGSTDIASFPPAKIYIFLGGDCTPDADQLAGDYADDVTLTATYN